MVVVGVLMFNNIGGSLSRNADRAVGLSPGLSLTTLSFFVLLFSLWQGWLIVRLGRALDSGARPSRGEASRLIKRGIFADLLGLVFAAVGYQSLAGALFVQASQQTPGIAIGGQGVAENPGDHLPGDALGAEQHPGAVRAPDRFAVLAVVAAADLPHPLTAQFQLRKAPQGAAPEQLRLDRSE